MPFGALGRLGMKERLFIGFKKSKSTYYIILGRKLESSRSWCRSWSGARLHSFSLFSFQSEEDCPVAWTLSYTTKEISNLLSPPLFILLSPPLFILLSCTRKSRLFSLAANEGRGLTQKWLLGWKKTLGSSLLGALYKEEIFPLSQLVEKGAKRLKVRSCISV